MKYLFLLTLVLASSCSKNQDSSVALDAETSLISTSPKSAPAQHNNMASNLIIPAPNKTLLEEQEGNIWSFEISLFDRHTFDNNNEVVITGDRDRLYAVNMTTGEEQWSQYIGDPIVKSIVVGDQVFVQAWHSVSAHNLVDGSLVWKFDREGRYYDIAADQSAIYVSGYQALPNKTEIFSLDLLSGELKWQYPIGENDKPKILVDNDTLYFIALTSQVTALSTRDAKIIWTTSLDHKNSHFTNIIASDQNLYFAISEHEFYCIDAKTGKVCWNQKMFLSEESTLPPLLLGESVYFKTEHCIYRYDQKSGALQARKCLAENLESNLANIDNYILVLTKYGKLLTLTADTLKLVQSERTSEGKLVTDNHLKVYEGKLLYGTNNKLNAHSIKNMIKPYALRASSWSTDKLNTHALMELNNQLIVYSDQNKGPSQDLFSSTIPNKLFAISAKTGATLNSIDVDNIYHSPQGNLYFTIDGVITKVKDESLASQWRFTSQNGNITKFWEYKNSLICLTINDTLSSLNIHTGKENWVTTTQSLNHHGSVINGDRLAAPIDFADTGMLIDLTTGKVINKYEKEAYTPQIFIPSGLLVRIENGIRLYSRETGEALWEHLGIKVNPENAVQYGDTLLIAGSSTIYQFDTNNGKLQKTLRLGKDQFVDMKPWKNHIIITKSHGISSYNLESNQYGWILFGNPLQLVDENNGYLDSYFNPATFRSRIINDIIYIVTASDQVYAISPDQGKLLWSKHYPIAGWMNLQKPTHNGSIFFSTGNGQLMSVDSVSGEVVWIYDMASPLSNSGLLIHIEDKVFVGGEYIQRHAIENFGPYTSHHGISAIDLSSAKQ